MLFKEHLKQKSWSHHWAYPQPASWQIKRIKKKISVGLEWTKGESGEKDKKNKEETFFFTEQRRNFIVHDIDGKENIERS